MKIDTTTAGTKLGRKRKQKKVSKVVKQNFVTYLMGDFLERVF